MAKLWSVIFCINYLKQSFNQCNSFFEEKKSVVVIKAERFAETLKNGDSHKPKKKKRKSLLIYFFQLYISSLQVRCLAFVIFAPSFSCSLWNKIGFLFLLSQDFDNKTRNLWRQNILRLRLEKPKPQIKKDKKITAWKNRENVLILLYILFIYTAF